MADDDVEATWRTGPDGQHIVEIFQEKRRVLLPGRPQRWRWRRLAANRRRISMSGEAYTNYADCYELALMLNPQSDPRAWTGRR